MLTASLKSLQFVVFVAFAVIVSISGCVQSINNESVLVKSLDIGITESSETIKRSNSGIYEAIKMKAADPVTSERAIAVLVKADSLRKKAERIKNLLSEYKNKIAADKIEMNDADLSDMLFEQIRNYNSDLVNVDSLFHTTAMANRLKLNNIEAAGLHLFEKNLLEVGVFSQSVFINKLIADVVIDENTLLNQLYDRLWTQGKCVFISPIVGISSSVISINDSVEILAGIGHFEAPRRSKMIVDGVTVYPGANGLFIYKYKPKGKRGKSIIPVQVFYTDADGNDAVTEMKLTLTIR
ncbi:MAG: hypothetical protein GXC73_00220 [Chitinophagaceae bacterium]|nr:hypothetical protein [Chitinophagaceae bacterium]